MFQVVISLYFMIQRKTNKVQIKNLTTAQINNTNLQANFITEYNLSITASEF